MAHEFNNMTYLAQVRRLRLLAKEALKRYPIGKYELRFVNHGENTTYKVRTAKKDHLLRIHCRSHRTKNAFLEELKWLKHLTKNSDIPVQKPIVSRRGNLIEEVIHEGIGHYRFCDLLQWEEGSIKNKKTPKTFFQVGKLIGELQKKTIKSQHRIYWDAQGLIGKNATLGPVSCLQKDFPRYTSKIEQLRSRLFKEVLKYEKRNKDKRSFIHGDLHFGNMIWEKGLVKPIDFDDCGYGLEMYDLAVTLAQSSHYFKKVGRKESSLAKAQLLEGYSYYKELSSEDIKILPYLVATREVAMLGWLYGRRDNPELWSSLKKNIGARIKKTDFYINQADRQTYFSL